MNMLHVLAAISISRKVSIMFLALHLLFYQEFALAATVTTGISVTSACAGNYFGCAAFSNDKVKCWGREGCWGKGIGTYYDNTGDELSEFGDGLPFVSISNGTASIAGIACGYCHMCVRFDSGVLKCLGWNGNGQIGAGINDFVVGEVSGQSGDDVISADLGTDIKALDITLGGIYTCAIVTGKRVKCYGNSASDALGIPSGLGDGKSSANMGDALPFVSLGVGVEVATIHASPESQNNCVVLSAPNNATQRIKCWGLGNNGQLGYGDTSNRGSDPNTMGDNLPLVDLGTESRVKQVSPGRYFTCALLITNNLKCWGYGGSGSLGSGSQSQITATGDALPFVEIDQGKTIKSVTTGKEHTCILYTDDVTFKCVGYNGNGELGQGDTNDRGNTPDTKFPNISAIDIGLEGKRIAAAYASHSITCVFLDNYVAKCWGWNRYAQLGSLTKRNVGDEPFEMGTNLTSIEFFTPTNSPTKSPTPPTTKTPTTNSPTNGAPTSPTKKPTSSPTKETQSGAFAKIKATTLLIASCLLMIAVLI